MKNKNKSIAILGGMGPQASARLVEVMISICSNEFGAKNDSDFPEIALLSVPVPNFISNKNNVDKVLRILKARVIALENFNPVCFGIACNTAHLMIDDLQKTTNAPFISIMEEVSKELFALKVKKVGLLSTPVTANSKLYQNKLDGDLNVVVPSLKDQKTVEAVIRNVLSNTVSDLDVVDLVKIADRLRERGAEAIILGCTELPLVFPKDFPLPIIDSIEILARGLLKKFYEKTGENAMIKI